MFIPILRPIYFPMSVENQHQKPIIGNMKEIFATESGDQIKLDVKHKFVTEFNKSTILIGDSDGRKLVVKFSAYSWGAQREWLGLEKVTTAGILSAKPVAFIPGEKSGIITEYLPGKNLKDEPDMHLRYQLGVLIKDMHERVSIEGYDWVKYGKSDFSFYDKKIDQWKQAHIGGTAIDVLKELAIDVGNSFKLIDPVFTHHDLYDSQVIHNKGKLYLIDFEFWRESHPLDDISLYLMNTVRTKTNYDYFWQFCKGYVDNKKSFTEEQKKVIVFFLLFASCQSLEFYRWNRPNDLNIATGYHQEALSLVRKESLWKKL